MNATLIRSSYTPIIYEGKDCSVAILDEHGDVLGQSLGLPLFLGNLEICVKLAAEMFGWDAFRPGDVFYMNDSYMTGTHLNDATIFGPIFWHDRLRRLLGDARALARRRRQGRRRADGLDARSSRRACAGAPTRIYDGGEPREDIIDLLAPQRPLRLLARRRHERAGRRLPHRRGALPGDPRPLRLRHLRRRARARSTASRRRSSARPSRRSPTAPTAPRDSSTTTGSGTARSRSSVRIDVDGRPDDDRPRGLVAA